ncbi:MAG TPA: hypothetical protein VHE99_05350 [Gammaproteobacteria bacterium]|nr:hypothetical protein [Gammaproteobacteria bacterium]
MAKFFGFSSMKKIKLFPKIIRVLLASIYMLNAYALPKGNSAWLYGKEQSWINQIQRFNDKAVLSHRFNYLFPEAGVVHVDSKHNQLLITYDFNTTKFYKSRLKNVKILPNLSFWVANTNFKHWSNIQYKKAADSIASIVNNDPNADGVFLDLESYSATLLPFYQEFAKQLRNKKKIISVIVRPGEEDSAWFQTLGQNAFVVLYGYDLHEPNDSALPVSPEVYQRRLKTAITNLMQVAKVTHTQVMGGIPLVATTYEWEQKIDKNNPSLNLKNLYHQIDYFKVALQEYTQIQSPLYLGLSVWAFVSDFSSQKYFPLTISSKEWQLLSKYAE